MTLQELRHGDMELEDALDWLCLHLPASQLPKQFQGIGQVASASGKASVIALAKAQTAPALRSSCILTPANSFIIYIGPVARAAAIVICVLLH